MLVLGVISPTPMIAAFNYLFSSCKSFSIRVIRNNVIIRIMSTNTIDLKNIAVDLTVDARGTACPGPLLAAKKAIGEIESGEIMEILSADEGSKHDIPRWCDKVGHEYLGFFDEDSFSRLFLIKE